MDVKIYIIIKHITKIQQDLERKSLLTLKQVNCEKTLHNLFQTHPQTKE